MGEETTCWTLAEIPMADRLHLLDEPELAFGHRQLAIDPRDGLSMFGPADGPMASATYVAIGTTEGLDLWVDWASAMNAPAACINPMRQRAWPPYPGFDVAFGSPWPMASRTYCLDKRKLLQSARKADKHERAYAVADLYLDQFDQIARLDQKPVLAVCIVPDEVYDNCRPLSTVEEPSDRRRTSYQRRILNAAIRERSALQPDLIGFEVERLEQYGFSPDFRRQLKARVMMQDIPVQIIRESTMQITEQIRYGHPGTNPLSDRLWNFGTGVYYKCGRKPWMIHSARDGVCYIGIAYRRAERRRTTACCAAQMFLDSGDGMIFVGEFGPWYSEERREFHLTPEKAHDLLAGTLKTYFGQGGRPLREIFLHSRSGINKEEFDGFRSACPPGIKIVGIRVRSDRTGTRLFRYDDHVKVTKRGKFPVLRGVFWQRSARHGVLFTNGFKPRIATYDGWEVPRPLDIDLQHGEGDLAAIATDILGLTKVNYNTCQLGEGQPITVRYSDRVGEILLANPEVDRATWRHNFKYYI